MGSRKSLQKMLETILGSKEVYFQPPESRKIKYPAIMYSLNNIVARHADNIPYLKKKQYSVIFITRDPDDSIIDELSELSACSFERFYTADNLNHYVFNLYF